MVKLHRINMNNLTIANKVKLNIGTTAEETKEFLKKLKKSVFFSRE